MGHDQKDFVDQLTEASMEARQALRELMSGIKEARKLIKELTNAVEEVAKKNVEEIVSKHIKIQMDTLGEATRHAMDDSVDKVSKEFDRLANLLMTGDTKGKSKDGFNIRDYVEKPQTGL